MSKTYYKQGIFIPRNKEKFKGTKATYRSSYELKFFHWADKNVNVKWKFNNDQKKLIYDLINKIWN